MLSSEDEWIRDCQNMNIGEFRLTESAENDEIIIF